MFCDYASCWMLRKTLVVITYSFSAVSFDMNTVDSVASQQLGMLTKYGNKVTYYLVMSKIFS